MEVLLIIYQSGKFVSYMWYSQTYTVDILVFNVKISGINVYNGLS